METILELVQAGAGANIERLQFTAHASSMLSVLPMLQSAQDRDSISSCEEALNRAQSIPSLTVQAEATKRKLEKLQRARESVLSERPDWLAQPGPPQLSIPPPLWAVKVSQLKKFLRHVRQTDVYKQLVLEHGAVNIYAVNDFMIIPWTE